MEEIKTNYPQINPYLPKNENEEEDMPPLDIPAPSDEENVIPDEVPRRDGPGGE